MRTSPLNYLLALATAGILWAICGVPVGNYLADNISLQQATTDDFVRVFRIALAIAAVLGFVGCAHWFFYGSREATAGDMPGARRVWNIWSLVLLISAVGMVAGVVLSFSNESFVARDYVVILLSASLVTWVLFWVASLLMSPRAVMYCVLGRR